jgi:hypothetical protein
MLCACAMLLSVVFDHYDKRDNEINYRRFARVAKHCGTGFLMLTLVLLALTSVREGDKDKAWLPDQTRGIRVLAGGWLNANSVANECMSARPDLAYQIHESREHFLTQVQKADEILRAQGVEEPLYLGALPDDLVVLSSHHRLRQDEVGARCATLSGELVRMTAEQMAANARPYGEAPP